MTQISKKNKNKQPLISVIVPAYNAAPYIERTLASLCAQTYGNIEIVVVNDGSEDDTAHHVKVWMAKDPRIRLITQENSGVTSARLRGVRESFGEWIGFCDADDFAKPEMYDTLMAHALKHHADIAHCGYEMLISGRTDEYYGTGVEYVQNKEEAIIDLLSGEQIEPNINVKLFKRKLFYKMLTENLIDCSIKINEDLLMNYYLFRDADVIAYIDKCMYQYIAHAESAVTGDKLFLQRLYDPIRVQRILLRETSGQQRLQKIIKGRIASMYASGVEIDSSKKSELIKPFRRECRRELIKLLPGIICGKYDIPSKIHVFLSCICPRFCRFVHKRYSIKKGTYEKYKVS